ncbi:MAG: substrate-binding domain-containing protein [Pseudomonadota bacterium]
MAQSARVNRPRVTINDLAEKLGLTKSTVSRALNGYSDIAPGTRVRVRKQAEAMGYRPLSHAQAIRTGRSRSIGLVLQTDLHDGYRPFLSEFLAGMTQAAGEEDWTLSIAHADTEDAVLERFQRLISERKVDGFVLPRTKTRDKRVALLRDLEMPFILFGRTEDDANCPWFDILGEDAMADAVMRLAHLGHRRIAHIGGQADYYYSVLRAEGFVRGMRQAGLEHAADLIYSDAATHARGYDAARRLFALDAPPTAIVAAVDLAALGAYDAASEAGLIVGRDVSIIGYDGSPVGAHANPPLSTFSVDSRQAGERLAALLIRRIRGEAPESLRELAEATFIPRGSVGPAPETNGQKKLMGGRQK